MADTELKALLRAGIAAARAGDKERARRLLLQVIERDQEAEAAWLWLSDVVDDAAERQICLENVLALNPDNQAAHAGLRWLREQPPAATAPPPPPGPAATPPPAPLAPAAAPAAPEPAPQPLTFESPPPPELEIDPSACPYCGGTIRAEEPRCLDCGRPVIRRYRRRPAGAWLGWLVVCFLLLGATATAEGLLAGQVVGMEQLPAILNETGARFFVGPALVTGPDGTPAERIEFAPIVGLVNYVLAGLCLAAAIGLAVRSRIAYFGAFLLGGLLVVATGAGLLTGLSGLIPSLLRLGLIALSVTWLADSAPAFEWQTRTYNADLDDDLRTDLDYYNRGQRYREMGMWAKAAAHWKVAAQMAPDRPAYRGHLARAYLQMGYPAAALAEVDRALARAPGDEELLAFRASLLERGGEA